jgi:DNA-binding transcriptional LysR family regulator
MIGTQFYLSSWVQYFTHRDAGITLVGLIRDVIPRRELVMRPDIDQLAAVCSVAETGSFSKSSYILGISKSLVSRRISTLENVLNVRLFSRTTNYVALTPIGHVFTERAKRILDEIDAAVIYVNGEMNNIVGKVRITAPSRFGIMYISPLIPELLSKYPQLNIDLDLNDNSICIPDSVSDFEIRIDNPIDSDFMMKYFKPIRQALVCSPEYKSRNGIPSSPEDIVRHECIVYAHSRGVAQWKMNSDKGSVIVHPSGRLRTNNWEFIRDASISGIGLAMLPIFAAKSSIENGDLIELLPDYASDSLSLYALFPPRAVLSTRVRAVVEFFSARWHKPISEPKMVCKKSITKSNFGSITAADQDYAA